MPLTAKFRTTCSVCAQVVEQGSDIGKAGSGWAHAACAAGAQLGLPLDGAVSRNGAPAGAPTSSGAGSNVATGPAGRPANAGARRPRPADMAPAPGALEVWTDGACSGNPGPGGWAWATRDGRQASGGAPATTNQRMEIQAALEAVRALDGPLVVVSDSTYVVNCFRDAWWRGWLARGWVNTAKKPVANRDLWEPLITEVNARGTITFRWVKGHSGDEMNDLVDRLAVEAGKAAVGSL